MNFDKKKDLSCLFSATSERDGGAGPKFNELVVQSPCARLLGNQRTHDEAAAGCGKRRDVLGNGLRLKQN